MEVAISGQTDFYHGSSLSPRAMFVDWEDTTGDLFSNLSFADEIINPPYSRSDNYQQRIV